MKDHTRKKQEAEIETLARKVLGDKLGQVIVGKHHVYVHRIDRAEPVLHIEHDEHAYHAARIMLRGLIRIGAKPLSLEEINALSCKTNPKAPHAWDETSRDVGATIIVNERCKVCQAERSLEADNEEKLADARGAALMALVAP